MISRVAMAGLAGLAMWVPGALPAQLPGVQIGDQTPLAERAPEEVIRAQLQAFNAHDALAMVANVHEDFAWFAVDSEVMTLEIRGRGEFHRSMREYFDTVAGARAELEEIFVAGDFVSARERAFWLRGGVEVSQASLAVYEIRGGLIYRAWYYPAFE